VLITSSKPASAAQLCLRCRRFKRNYVKSATWWLDIQLSCLPKRSVSNADRNYSLLFSKNLTQQRQTRLSALHQTSLLKLLGIPAGQRSLSVTSTQQWHSQSTTESKIHWTHLQRYNTQMDVSWRHGKTYPCRKLKTRKALQRAKAGRSARCRLSLAWPSAY